MKKVKKTRKTKRSKPAKVVEPQFYQSQTGSKVLNYRVYYYSLKEKMGYTLLALLVGGAVGYLFYGGLGKDSYGNATMLTSLCNVLFCGLAALVAARVFLPLRKKSLLEKRKKTLRAQFVDMLDALSTSLGAGRNMNDSFRSAYEDLKMQYGESAHIVQELNVILTGIANNMRIEELLLDFGSRSGVVDIECFANVFAVSFRTGGNMKEIIRNTHEIIHDKVAIEMEIAAMAASNNMEQNIMIVMPILIMVMMKTMGSSMAAGFQTVSGVITITVCVGIFVLAYMIGRKILNIEL